MNIHRGFPARVLSLLLFVFILNLSARWQAAHAADKPVLIALIHSEVLDRTIFGGEISGKVKSASDAGASLAYLSVIHCQEAPERIPGRITGILSDIAETYNINLLAVLDEEKDGRHFRASVLIDRDGAIKGVYRQVQVLGNDGLSAGDSLPVFAADFGTIACKSGEDFNSPEIDFVYSLKGARIIFCLSAEKAGLSGGEKAQLLACGQARDCGAYYAVLNADADPEKSGNGYPEAFAASPDGELCSFSDGGRGLTFFTVPGDFLGSGPEERILAGDIAALLPEGEEETSPIPPKGKIRAAIIPGSLDFKILLSQLDRAGHETGDIACLPGYQWNGYERLAKLNEIAQKAAAYRMYIAVGFSQNHEIIVFDREGKQAGEYNPARMHHALSPGKRAQALPIIRTDFGKIGLLAEPDIPSPLFMRMMTLRGVNLFLLPVPFNRPLGAPEAASIRSRALLSGAAVLIAQNPSIAAEARSMIIDGEGALSAAALFNSSDCITAEITLKHDKPVLRRSELFRRELEDIISRIQ